ncbi:NADP-dependent oxidoreductase [Candidatus Methylacidiphilum fumarolicum]|jgi:NADPH-dependent curcumin reductase CurA|uniref:NADP-dependent oxidoreductase n=2 Tax=Candidatus Methylacidiphilum fumarolicum TaxID=591154 RepID=A0ABM9IAR5_9BACT|nr:NADP-dependent oxidoreductase [Candidatus Methylacidiphilum fumarolicum]MBW6414718.1 NADP-dependent oxidoreductase [Candidatus Methylacidiphilum fumarolicum]TFE70143.1 NADP-dependent oxidoreductase [Candidatus Methylacidiphilum fumarolicum]TFE74289.1 NADP-dependent oxidoreductase [Candidatus Methylacidiphilum fumarolicum]TFE75788.1 NADP-dependent oxidoreductase [Candidatus Methylacidiphilum fumarolicum]TFE75948.1 NADP-dependent oxidoreductase [Candidatus Methylacidiphilum fumarolicum]
MKNKQVILVKKPEGLINESHFSIVSTDIPTPKEGEVLVKNRYVSIDPYLRLLTEEPTTFSRGVKPGSRMESWSVGEVVESKSPVFQSGQYVLGYLGWQEYGLSNERELRPIDPSIASLPAFLGVLGMPGITAYLGMFDYGKPQAGQTVLISAAAGTVGMTAGQFAKMHSCKVVGITDSEEKCRFLLEELNFDSAINEKRENLEEKLKQYVPEGIDLYYDNVGGETLDTALLFLRKNSRVVICGMISQYNVKTPYAIKNFERLHSARATLKGFIVGDRTDRWPEAIRRLEVWVKEKKLKHRENVFHGLENAPKALHSIFTNAPIGKTVVEV